MKKNDDFEQMKSLIAQYSHERDRYKFHDGKDLALALALSIEASELNEAYLRRKS